MGCGSSNKVHDSVIDPLSDKTNRINNPEVKATKKRQVEPVEDYSAKRFPKKDIVIEDLEKEEEEDKDWVKISARSYSVQDWKQLIQSLLADTDLKHYAHARSRSSLGSIENLRSYLNACPYADSEVKKAWLAYLWITEFISYDVIGYQSGNLGDNTSIAVFNRGKCVCEGYSSIFFDHCNSMGLSCKKLSGYSKGAGYKLGDRFNQTDHAWNIIRLNGKWQLVECTWGAGYSEGSSFVKRFEPYYFCSPPQIFIFDHLPVGDGEMTQRLDKAIGLEQFEKTADLRLQYHVQGFEMLSNKNGKLLIEAKTNPYLLEFKIPKNSKLLVDLKHIQTRKDLPRDNILLQYDRDGEKAAALIWFDTENLNEKYELSFFANSSASNSYELMAKFIVDRIGSNRLTNMPKYDLVFGTMQRHIECLSHKCLWIEANKNPLILEFKIGKRSKLLIDLKLMQTGKKLPGENILLQYDRDGERAAALIWFDSQKLSEKYELNLFANSAVSSTYEFMTKFIVDRIGCDRLINLPRYELVFGSQSQLECLSHKSLWIEAKTNPLLLEFKMPKNTKILADLKLMQSEKQIARENILFQYDGDGEKVAALILFDSQNMNEKYELSLFANSSSVSTSYEFMTKFIVNRIGSDRLANLPKYELCFGTQYQMECLSHKSLWIDSQQSQLKMEFKNFGNNFIDGHLSDFKTGKQLKMAVLKQLNPLTNKFEFLINLPERDRVFLLRVDCGKKTGISQTYQSDYAKFYISTMGMGRAPSSSFLPDLQFIKIESDECYVHEPLAYELKSNWLHQFKIRYKNADMVWLEDSSRGQKYFKSTDDEPDIWTLSASFAQPQDLELKITYTTEIGQRYTTKAVSYKIVA